MAWDDTKATDDELTANEWNAMVTDQKTRITAASTDTLTNKTIDTASNTLTVAAADVSDFDTEVSNNTDVSANTSARHDAVTLAGTPDYITLSGQTLTRNAIDLANDVTGSLPVANLDSGTNASSSTFWRGDGTWAEPSGGGGGAGNTIITFSVDGELSTGTKAFYAIPDELNGLVVKEVRLMCLGLPAGADLQVDIRKNGTASTDSIFTSDVPIEVGTGASATNGVYQSACDTSGSRVGTAGTTLDSARDDVASDDVLFAVVTQVGSTVAGSDLRVQITFGSA